MTKVVPDEDVVFAASSGKADIPQGSQSTIAPGSGGLENISDEAIDHFCNTVGNVAAVPEHARRAFAYGTRLRYADVYCCYALVGAVPKQEAAEFIRVVCGPNTQKTDLTKLLQESTDMSHILKSLPEFEAISNLCSIRYDKEGAPYSQLLKLPPRGRTFFAGLLAHLNVPGESHKTEDPFEKMIRLRVSSRQVIDYAVSIGIQDVTTYLEMLKGVRT